MTCEPIWTRSSKCEAGHCVEVAWTTSSRCSTAQGCVEVGHEGDRVLVRDSKLGDESPVIEYTRGEWLELLAQVREDEWVDGIVSIGDGEYVWQSLVFTAGEIDKFVAGIQDGEFVPESEVTR